MLLNGCASSVALYSDAAHRDFFDTDVTIPRVYAGTVFDCKYLFGDDPDGLLMIFDLPLSAAADTVTLPGAAGRRAGGGGRGGPRPGRGARRGRAARKGGT